MLCNPNITADTSRCFVDCANQPCDVAAYGDIGGIGVILGFTITAWLVVCLVIAYYIMVYDYSLDPFRGKDDYETVLANPNPVDRVFLTTVRKFHYIDYSQATVETKKNINSICNKCVVNFADLQIMTGIGILISGVRPTMCGLQMYHWQIIVHLAWFSSITHLSALSFLRHYIINCRREYYIRGILMAIFVGLLAVAVGLAGHFDWEDPNKMTTTIPSHFARCVFIKSMNRETLAFESMIFDLLLIGYGYTIRLLKAWKTVTNWPVKASKRLNERSSRMLRDWRPHDAKGGRYVETNFLQPIRIAFLRIISLQINMFTSYLAEVFWLIISCVWRTIRLERLIRQHRPALESDWTFGQILPMLMLATPLILLSGTAASVFRRRLSSGNQSEEEATTVEATPATHTPSATPEDQDITDIRDGGLRGSISVINSGESIPGVLAQPGRHDRPPDDENARFLESSPAFKGSVFLVALPYFEFGVYLLVGDRKGFLSPFLQLVVSLVFLIPFLQTLWLTYTTWASRIPLISHIPVGFSSLNFTVFVTLVAGGVVSSPSRVSSLPAFEFIMIGGIYSVLTIWAAFTIRSSGGTLRYIRLGPLTWIARCLVSLALIVPFLVVVALNLVPALSYLPLPLTFYCLFIFGGAWLEKRRWKYIRPARLFVIFVVIVAIDVQGWHFNGGVYPFFNPLVDFAFWLYGWAIIILIWPVAGMFGWI